METRAKIFGFLAFACAMAIVFGVGLGAIEANRTMSIEASSGRGINSFMSTALVGMVCLTALPYLCVAGPLGVFFALMAWRNDVGAKTERRHKEQVEAILASLPKQE